MFERFTEKAIKVIMLAQEEAREEPNNANDRAVHSRQLSRWNAGLKGEHRRNIASI